MLINLPDEVKNLEQLKKMIAEFSVGKPSPLVDKFYKANPRLNKTSADKHLLVDYLQKLAASPAILHITFAQDYDDTFITLLLDWLRENVDPQILLDIQIDPLITGGVILRSPQRIYDWSWRRILTTTKPQLEEAIIHAR